MKRIDLDALRQCVLIYRRSSASREMEVRRLLVEHGWKATACRVSFAPDPGKTIRPTFDPPTVITTTRPCAILRTGYVSPIPNKTIFAIEGEDQ